VGQKDIKRNYKVSPRNCHIDRAWPLTTRSIEYILNKLKLTSHPQHIEMLQITEEAYNKLSGG